MVILLLRLQCVCVISKIKLKLWFKKIKIKIARKIGIGLHSSVKAVMWQTMQQSFVAPLFLFNNCVYKHRYYEAVAGCLRF